MELHRNERNSRELRPDPGRARLLLLDDDLTTARLVRGVLEQERYEVEWAPNVATAMDLVLRQRPELALVDVYLSNGTGWEFVEWCRTQGLLLPIVMLTGHANEEERQRAFRAGADRYLVKPVLPQTLRRVVDEVVQIRRDEWWSASPRRGGAPSVSQLLHDPTTDVALLTLALESLREPLRSGSVIEVFCIRLEPLVSPGAKLGWEAFDRLRRDFVRGLHIFVNEAISVDAMVATTHPGANDFYIFNSGLPSGVDESTVEGAAHTLLNEISTRPGGEELNVVVGVAATHKLPYSPERLLFDAVREAGDRAGRRESRLLHHLEHQLRRAIRDELLLTHFQPIVRLDNFEVCGYEALTRGPSGSEIESPEVIFRLARDGELVWDLEQLCIGNLRPYLSELLARGRLFVNLEAQFLQLLDQRGTSVLDVLSDYASSVVLEVTERSAIHDFPRFRKVLRGLKASGFAIAIDDCGSGYASLESIAELRPDYLKVGHGLFHGVVDDPVRRKLVELVVQAADAIGATTVAEAIETEEQLALCRELGIPLGQGYMFARPSLWETAAGYGRD